MNVCTRLMSIGADDSATCRLTKTMAQKLCVISAVKYHFDEQEYKGLIDEINAKHFEKEQTLNR